jgi:mutator protein MutT
MKIDKLQIKVSVIIILKRENTIFMFKRKNTGWEDGKYTVPSGHVDVGETPTQAAIRETKEEVGVDIDAINLKLVHIDFIKDSMIDFAFIVENWTGEAKVIETDKAEDGEWFEVDHLPQNIAGHGKQILENLARGEFYIEII